MFIRILNEPGDYLNEYGEEVNLIYGQVIYTPNGKVTTENLQGWIYYKTLAEAIYMEKLEEKPIVE